jgi:Tfp pilus assembly protein PilO
MKKLSKGKRNQLLLSVIITLTVVSGLWYGVISLQQDKIASLEKDVATADAKLKGMNKMVSDAATIEVDLAAASEKLEAVENEMATGDLFAWFLKYLNNFKVAYQVNIPQLGQPAVGAVPLIPDFPYKQVAFTVVGSAYYHDLGVFVSDLENQSPYVRVENLELSPVSSEKGSAEEKLSFKMNIVFLIKPGTVQS